MKIDHDQRIELSPSHVGYRELAVHGLYYTVFMDLTARQMRRLAAMLTKAADKIDKRRKQG